MHIKHLTAQKEVSMICFDVISIFAQKLRDITKIFNLAKILTLLLLNMVPVHSY
jgi:hypothetical protein